MVYWLTATQEVLAHGDHEESGLRRTFSRIRACLSDLGTQGSQEAWLCSGCNAARKRPHFHGGRLSAFYPEGEGEGDAWK